MPRVTFDKAEEALIQLLHLREGYDRSYEVVAWAQLAIAEGRDTESLRILAGLGEYPNAFETHDYFERALGELGIEPGTEQGRRTRYIRLLCETVVSETLDPVTALIELVEVCDVDAEPGGGDWWELYDRATLDPETARQIYGPGAERGLEPSIRLRARRWLSAHGNS